MTVMMGATGVTGEGMRVKRLLEGERERGGVPKMRK